MIERSEIEGQPVLIAYLDNNLEPVDKDDATLVKVIFEDTHRTVWLTPQRWAITCSSSFRRCCIYSRSASK